MLMVSWRALANQFWENPFSWSKPSVVLKFHTWSHRRAITCFQMSCLKIFNLSWGIFITNWGNHKPQHELALQQLQILCINKICPIYLSLSHWLTLVLAFEKHFWLLWHPCDRHHMLWKTIDNCCKGTNPIKWFWLSTWRVSWVEEAGSWAWA